MLDIVLLFLGASLVLYAVLGGADFGAGIMEFLSPKSIRIQIEDAVYKAMGPVWEANHMWLILAVVILFNGFPKAYAEISILLHIPLTLMLMGIIVRGCAFTFRHYDAFSDGSSRFYSQAFRGSSLVTTLLLGNIVGALTKGQFPKPHSTASYWDIYWQPWLTPFCFAVGVFTCILFAYIAAVFLNNEEIAPHLRQYCARRAKQLHVAAIFGGLAVFALAYTEGVPLTTQFFTHPLAVGCFILATVLIFPIWRGLGRANKWRSRILLAVQISAVLLGWIGLRYPVLISYRDGSHLDLLETAAGPETLLYLQYALIVGSLVIFPMLFYLFRVFKQPSRADTAR